MNAFQKLNRYFALREAVIRKLSFEGSEDLVIACKVSEWNFKKDFFFDYNLPTEREAASAAIVDMFPECFVNFRFKNVIRFRTNRLKTPGRPDLLFVDVPPPVSVNPNDGPWTIVSFGFVEHSPDLDALGPFKERCRHLQIDTVDLQIEIVFEDVMILGLRDPVLRHAI